MYLRYGFTRTKIAEIMGISRKTVTRRIDAFGLSDSLPCYPSIENNTLDSVVQDNGLLDISNDNDLYCLHFVFLQRINRHVHLFQDGYDNHTLSSESNNMSMQLWIEGMQNYQTMQPSDLSGEDIEHYGIDWEGPLPSERYDGPTYGKLDVSVPIIHCSLSDDQIDQFVSAVDLLAESSSHGIDLYLNARDCLESLLSNNSV